MSNANTNIARRLRSIREQLKWSRTDAAMALGIGSERLASYEAARCPVPKSILPRITSVYQCQISWLLGGGKPFNHVIQISDGAPTEVVPRGTEFMSSTRSTEQVKR